MGFLVNRFAEHSSAVGMAALIGGGWQLYSALQGHPVDGNVVTGALTTCVFGLVAFLTKDGQIVDTLKSITKK